MQLITTYSPPTFLRPVAVFSTIFNDAYKETAVCFVEALNGNHALKVIYTEGEPSKKSKFIVIKMHKTMAGAIKFHTNLAKQMRNGVPEKIWNAGYKPYLKIYKEFCPQELKTV